MNYFKLTGKVRSNGLYVESRWYAYDVYYDESTQCLCYDDSTLQRYIKLMNDICNDVKVKYMYDVSRYKVDEINRRDGFK